MNSLQKHSRGISLLEVLLVFLVAAMISLLGVEHYRSMHQDADLLVVRKNVDILMNAVNTYYRQYQPKASCSSCKQALMSTSLWPYVWPEIDPLTQAKPSVSLLPSRLISSSDDSYDVSINLKSSTNPHDTISVTITFKPQLTESALAWYKAQLNASSSDTTNNQLTWQQLPSHNIPSVETNLWIFNSSLEQFKKQNEQSKTPPLQP